MTEALTPMMQQYQRVKREIPSDALLLFRLGDFFEMFFDDARITAELLNLTLTQRNGIPMCGIPHHAAENYIARLIRAGRKVAICDQLEEAGQSRGLIKRDVTQILSPGTVMADRYLAARQHNFIAALCARSELYGLAWLDITTGDFRLTELPDVSAMLSEVRRLAPAELLLPEGETALASCLGGNSNAGFRLSFGEPWTFQDETAFLTLRDQFKTQSLDGFGCQGLTVAIGAAGGLIHYLQHQLRRQLTHIHRLHVYFASDFMTLDAPTQRNLELLDTRPSTPLPGSTAPAATLIGSLDRTVTPMGARLLCEWVSHPLRSVSQIAARHQVIAELLEPSFTAATADKQGLPLVELRERLRSVKDLERLISRLASGNGNARDLGGLKLSLQALPALGETTVLLRSSLAAEQHQRIHLLPDLVDLISRSVNEDPPLALKEGGLIQSGYDPVLDELRQAMRSGKDWIAQLQQQEIERTGIKSLKVRFNSVFGYYIEITKSNLAQAPAHYIRKQTVATGERFITPELKDMENKILGAEERSIKLEYELFLRVREEAARHSAAIQESARAIAILDVLASFAETANCHNYVRPTVDEGERIQIVDGRHPVIEQVMQTDPNHMGKGGFVPNDTLLDGDQNQVILITGPNMAGKSTYIRQVALVVLMAQIGSFVPARSAHLGVVDRIFTRVGASDDISRGQSTFMVEMNETASILNNATEKSLIILDEIGRGTSTYDGISIAWAVAEYLHERVKAKTLFATHYHELTSMARRFPRVKNFNVAVREWNDQIIFLRKIQPGGADKSYGIQVARLAGLPREVIHRAKEMLNHLEATDRGQDPSAPGDATPGRLGKGELFDGQPSSTGPWSHAAKGKEDKKDSASSNKPVKPTSQMLLFASKQPKD